MLEELEAAKKRGARIYAELAATACRATRTTSRPRPRTATGPARVMRNALADAGIDAGRIDYINAHGTSTPLGDKAETIAIKTVFGDHARSSRCPRRSR